MQVVQRPVPTHRDHIARFTHDKHIQQQTLFKPFAQFYALFTMCQRFYAQYPPLLVSLADLSICVLPRDLGLGVNHLKSTKAFSINSSLPSGSFLSIAFFNPTEVIRPRFCKGL